MKVEILTRDDINEIINKKWDSQSQPIIVSLINSIDKILGKIQELEKEIKSLKDKK